MVTCFWMQRRLLIGLGLTAAAVALALIPTAELRGKPPKPLFFYLTPLVRVQVSPTFTLLFTALLPFSLVDCSTNCIRCNIA